MAEYNYEGFEAGAYNLNKFEGPELGTKAPDFTVTTMDGTETNLLEFPGKFLVLELGSITCPLFQGRREGMSDLAKEFEEVSFSILYVREAHPGNRIPAHTSMEEKSSCANRLNEEGETRRILLDDLQGAAHSGYGGYPNAIFVVNRNGCIVFRSDWNSVPATRKALKRLVKGQPAQSKSYFTPIKPTVLYKTLKESGDGALKEFLISFPVLIWKNVIRRNFLLFFSRQNTVAADCDC